MKRFAATAVASFAFAAGAAHAGGCTYGQHQASIASAEDAVQESVQEEADPRLLAQLKAQDAAGSESVIVPN